MRARNVKPSFFQNEQLAELPFEARLLFVGLWCLADREGRLEDRYKRIKMHVFPADTLDVDCMLTDLADQDLIVRYVVEGKGYIWIPGFSKHQRPHSKEVASQIPAFHEEHKTPTLNGAGTNLGNGQHALIPDPPSLIPDCSPPESGAQAPTTAPVAVTETPSAGRQDRATRIPADFTLSDERRAVAVAERVDPERTFAKFCNHWRAKGGQAARKVDWEATWRNWCMEDADRQGRNGGVRSSEPRKTRYEQMQEALANATET